MEYYSGFYSSLHSSKLYIVCSLTFFVSANFPNSSQAKVVPGSFLFWGIRDILLHLLTFLSIIFCERLSGLPPSLFQFFTDRHDALKAPPFFCISYLSFCASKNCISLVTGNQNWMLIDCLGSFCFSRKIMAFQ